MEADAVDINTFPRILSHRNAMNARPAVARAVAAHDS
jgi:hypothetical protein